MRLCGHRTSFERQRLVEKGLLEDRADGVWALTQGGWQEATRRRDPKTEWIERERARREARWSQLRALSSSATVPPGVLRELDIYAGARGIYADLAATRSEWTPYGVGMSYLHLGERYANEMRLDGVLYHFPSTRRPGRDASEIAATIAA